MDFRSFVLLLLLALLQRLSAADRLKLCVVESSHTTKRIRRLCPRLVASESHIECTIGSDRLDCLRQLAYGDADFTVLEPEDLQIAAAYREYNVLVTNELRLLPQAKQSFEMVVVVRKNVKTKRDMADSRYCHPGLENEEDWNKPFSMYIDSWLMDRSCTPTKTLLENRLGALASYFPKSCMAGPWTPDASVDRKLKRRYSRLCRACESPDDCSSSDKYHGREGALLCLTDNAGDIAWARLDDAVVHFRNEKIDRTTEEYSFFCPNGSTVSLDSQKPCVWISRPWPVIVARSQMAETVTKTMNSDAANDGWGERILEELMENYRSTAVRLDTPQRPQDYLRGFPDFLGASSRAPCRPSRTVHWCVASNLEYRKCRSMREASIVYGVEPDIACVQRPNRTACLDAVANEQADVFVARPQELLQARRRGLKAIVHAMPKKTVELDGIAAVVKQNSGFKRLRDLRGAKACFTGYGDVGWNAFVSIMRNTSDLGDDCSDVKAVGKFFKDSCVPDLSGGKEDVPYNLYSLCKQAERQAWDDVSAFDCLTSGLGDVAFVNMKIVEQSTGTPAQFKGRSKEYRRLCPDNEKKADENSCLLAWTPLNSVVARENTTNLRREEIYLMLLEINDLFGHSFKGQTPAFSMYGIFDTVHDVIFQEETQYLVFEDHQVLKARNYSGVVEDIVKREHCNGSSNLHGDNGVIFLVLLAVLGRILSIEL